MLKEKKKQIIRSSQDSDLNLLDSCQMFLSAEALEVLHWSRGYMVLYIYIFMAQFDSQAGMALISGRL